MVQRNVNLAPGLYKIFDEILVNAADNKVRDPNMDTLRVDINVVSIYFLMLQSISLCISFQIQLLTIHVY